MKKTPSDGIPGGVNAVAGRDAEQRHVAGRQVDLVDGHLGVCDEQRHRFPGIAVIRAVIDVEGQRVAILIAGKSS